jgi:hypothetical protein
VNVVILDHHLDAPAGVYRLIFGTPIVTDIPDPDFVFNEEENGPQTPPMIQVTTYSGVADVVWEANDERWFGEHGRRPADEIAAEQRDELRAALEAREQQTDPPPPPEPMPGIGEAL